MYTNGFIKLHRSILDWEWYADANTFRLFLHILLRVNYRPALWKNKVMIERGSMLTSVQSLARETGLTVSQTKSALRHLQDSKQIEIRTTNKYTVITVVNYSFYQGSDGNDDKQNGKQDSCQTGKQIANNIAAIEEDKEIKKLRREYIAGKAGAQGSERVEYAEVTELFNRICTSLPQVQALNDKRRQAIRAASGTVADFGGWEKLFETVQRSNFLTGRSGAWSGCGFDWILKSANLIKIIEGNYNDAARQKENPVDCSHMNIGTVL